MTLTEPQIGAFVAVLARAGGLVATAPVIGDQGVPARAKLVFVLAICAVIGPNRPDLPLADVGGVAIIELAVGVLTGLSARFIMARAAVAGQLFGLSLGLGFANQYDPHAGESAGTMRMLVMTIAGLVFLAAGGLETVVRSASAGPATIGQVTTLGATLLAHGTTAFSHGLALAAPIILATLVGNIGMALISRAAPSANVFSVAMPAILILGGLALVGSSGELLGGLTNDVREALNVLTGNQP